MNETDWAVVSRDSDGYEQVIMAHCTKEDAVAYVREQGGLCHAVPTQDAGPFRTFALDLARVVKQYHKQEQAARALSLVLEERTRQDIRFGPPDNDALTWLAVLGEEYGELCQAVLQTHYVGNKAKHLKAELIQVIAVGLAYLEQIERETAEQANES